MRRWSLAAFSVLLLPLVACEAFAPPTPFAVEPSSQPDPEVDVGQFRFGTVRWSDVDTSCADDAWAYEEAVTVLVEGEQVSLWFDTMPELNGTLSEDSAAVVGTMQFPGDTGAMVTCSVTGDVKVSDAGIEGEMEEQLSSTGDVNCVSRGRYTVIFE